MKRLSTVLSSDALTRNLTKFSAGSLYRGLAHHWDMGLPSLVGHDSHRPIGWTLPTFVSLQPGLTRLHGAIWLPESKDEEDALCERYQSHLASRIATEVEPFIEELRQHLALHLRGDERPTSCGAVALEAKGLARRAAAEVFEHEDKDGLVPLELLTQIEPGVYQHGALALFAHPYLRRSLSRLNSLNAPLLGDLWEVAKNSNVSARVKLDSDAVGLTSTVRAAVELTYWFGPKFTEDVHTIECGVTRHDAEERERFFHGISRTEFWWQSRAGEHILEVEELRDLPTMGAVGNRFGCRYVHSIVDESAGRIRHLDGAIRGYSEEELLLRLDQSIAIAGRNTEYTKLWRVDGELSLSHWKSLIHNFYRDNFLVGEYLGAPQVSNRETNSVAEQPEGCRGGSVGSEDRRCDFVPVRLTEGESVRLLLSVHQACSPMLEAPRVARPVERLVLGGCETPFIDAETIEIDKILRKSGERLAIPAGAVRMAHEDRYHAFPLIQHDRVDCVFATIDALGELVAAWNKCGQSRVLAFSLGAMLEGRELRVGVMGTAVDVQERLELVRRLFKDLTEEGIAGWVDDAANQLAADRGCTTTTHDAELIDRHVTPLTTFGIRRRVVQHHAESSPNHDDGETQPFRVRIDDDIPLSAVRSGGIHIASAVIINRSVCTRCGQEYIACDCSKFLDEGVGENCLDASPAFLFWTDRPA